MNFDKFICDLSGELAMPLPGESAQLKMASLRRLREMMKDSTMDSAVKSSVLILLYPDNYNHEVLSVLIQRTSYDGVHGGQISLPGGKTEEADIDLKYTAIRETYEELGVEVDEITIIGNLSNLYIPPSNFLVYPFVGFTRRKPVFKPDPSEVDGIIEIRINDLKEDRIIKSRNITLSNNITITTPCFDFDGNTVWGATAMIMSEFREILLRINN